MVGGFNRDDVATYIQELTMRHKAEMDELREQLKESAAQVICEKGNVEKLQAEKAELETRVAELSEIAKERDTLLGELESAREKCIELSDKLNSAESELVSLRDAKTSLENRVSGYMNVEQELNKNKERIADLELSAIRRASEIEAQARARMEEEAAMHTAEIAEKEREFMQYSAQKRAEADALVREISDAYTNVKNAVSGFKTGFKEVVSSLAREIDVISEKCVVVEQAFDELKNKCDASDCEE